MNFTSLLALSAICLTVLSASTASAEFYAGLQAQSVFLRDADNRGAQLDFEDESETGYGISGVFGYEFGNGLRLEAEAGYRRNSLERVNVRNDGGLGAALGFGSLNGASLDADGHIESLNLMANAWYDFKFDKVRPYIGGGVGLARIAAEGSLAGVNVLNDEDTVLAYQLGGGIGFDVMPAITLSLDYRYFATRDAALRTVTGNEFDAEYQTHNVGVSVRYRF
jgi:opacity protein-like surface antigen